MGKIISSPVKKWSGTVTIYDPITLPQAIAIEEAQENIRELLIKAKRDAGLEDMELSTTEEYIEAINKGLRFSVAKRNQILWPALRQCIETWNINGLDFPDNNNFPATPRERSAQLLLWLYDEIATMFEETEEEKNE